MTLPSSEGQNTSGPALRQPRRAVGGLAERTAAFCRLAVSAFEDIHVTRAADSLLAVSGGRVVLAEPLRPRPCPLGRRLGAADVCGYVHGKVRRWGMFTPRRKLLHHGTWVPFGASEMLMRAVAAGRADGAVLACDGIGTLVCHRPELIQGVGARMNGLFYTTPYEALVSRALGLGALIPAAGPGTLDPLAGLKAAASAGMKSVGVTVAGPQAMLAGRIRRAAVLLGVEAVVMSVCNSGLSPGESMAAAEADILWGCAGDRALMDALEGRVLLQLGLKSPVFALTPAGVGLALSSTAGGAAPRADGGSLMGTDSELPEGAFAGTVGPVRVRLAEGVELPRSNGGTCAR